MVVLAGQHGHTVMVTYPYAYMTYIVSPLAGLDVQPSKHIECLVIKSTTHHTHPHQNNTTALLQTAESCQFTKNKTREIKILVLCTEKWRNKMSPAWCVARSTRMLFKLAFIP